MNIQIQNVSYSSAAVTWSAIPHCPESFYHIIYRPNWNSIFSGYARPNFHFEETVPNSATSLLLEKLSPSTTYILCITCKNTYPSSDHCTTFNTVGDNPLILSRMGLGMNNVVWMMSCILFLLLLSVLIYSCLHCWCSKQHTQLGKYTSAAFPTSPAFRISQQIDLVFLGLALPNYFDLISNFWFFS
uniref:Fibronectin type III domain containing 9 n=1 Tax=Erpetoichthys calabaricus TaxID=27687 RepID=A0A8C4T7W3_ERPCA